MAEKKEQDPKLDHPTYENVKGGGTAPRDVDRDKLQVEPRGNTPDQRVEKGDTSASAEDALQGKNRGFGTPERTSEVGGATGSVEIKDKNKALSKEELLQKPSGTGEVRVGGEEPTPEDSSTLLAKAQEILNKYGGQESNIPVDSDYWVLMNKHRGLAKDEKEVRALRLEQEREAERNK